MNRRLESIQVLNLLAAYTQNQIISSEIAKNCVVKYVQGDNSELEKILKLEIPHYLIPTREDLRKYAQ